MEPQRYKKTKILLLLLLISLLLHLIMSFFFLEFGFRKRFTSFITTLSNSINKLSPKDKLIIEQKREIKHEALQKIFEAARHNKKPINFMKSADNRQAKLVAPKSNLGWVIFDNNYEKPKKLELPTTKSSDLMEVKLSTATKTKPKKLEPKATQPKDDHDIKPSDSLKKQKPAEIKHKIKTNTLHEKNKPQLKKEETKRLADTIIVDENIKKELNIADKQILETQKPQAEQINPQSQNTSIDNRIKKIHEITTIESKIEEEREELAQESLTPKQVIQHNTVFQNKEQERKTLLNAILKKKNPPNSTQTKLSNFNWGLSNAMEDQFNKVANGYIFKIIGEDGNDLIDQNGDPNKKPSVEEIKYISYKAKIIRSIQSTWEYNSTFYKRPHEPGIYLFTLEFEIDYAGRLINSKISESSGNKDLDKSVIRNLRFSAPFPPLPKSFNTKVCKMSLPCNYIVP